MMTGPSVSLSPLELERFGIVTARCSATTSESLQEVITFCHAHGVELLIARCDAASYSAAQAIEGVGGRLMDALVYYSRRLAHEPPAMEPDATSVRPFRAEDVSSVRDLAATAFEGYSGHYHADSRLDRAKADETYADWALRSCLSREVASEVLVAEHGRELVGFLTLRLNGMDEGEIVLNGVAPAAQGRGVYPRLLHGAIVWARARGAARLVVSTQLTNHRAQRVWIRAGFEPDRAQYTFHVWLS